MTDANKAAQMPDSNNMFCNCENLDQLAGALSTMNFSDKHPDHARYVLSEILHFAAIPAANTGDYIPRHPGAIDEIDDQVLDQIEQNNKAALQRPEPSEGGDCFDKFVEMLDREPQHKPRLAALLQEHAPRQVDVEAMAKVYEEERAKYVGGSVYYPNNQAAYQGAMQKALYSQRGLIGKAQTVPEGWKLVPSEPTPEMTLAAFKESHNHVFVCDEDPLKVGIREKHAKVYKAMIEVAPPAQPDEVA